MASDLRTGNRSSLRLAYAASSDLKNVAVSVGFFTSKGEGALFVGTEISGQGLEEMPRTGVVTV